MTEKRETQENAFSKPTTKAEGLKNQKAQESAFKTTRRILGFAMRNLCFASRVSEIRLKRLSSSRGAAIKGLSRKAESIKKTTPIILMALLLSACTTTKEAVYIPTKCKTKDIPKPMPSKESSVSEDVAEILKYTELLERDLEFCKGDGQ